MEEASEMAVIKNRRVPGGNEFWDHVEKVAAKVRAERKQVSEQYWDREAEEVAKIPKPTVLATEGVTQNAHEQLGHLPGCIFWKDDDECNCEWKGLPQLAGALAKRPATPQAAPGAAHILHTCEDERCFTCNGGLALCTICGGAEATLPTHCPGNRMTTEQQEAVQNKQNDYVNGAWISAPSSPASKQTVVHVPIPEGNNSRYVEVLREQSPASEQGLEEITCKHCEEGIRPLMWNKGELVHHLSGKSGYFRCTFAQREIDRAREERKRLLDYLKEQTLKARELRNVETTQGEDYWQGHVNAFDCVIRKLEEGR